MKIGIITFQGADNNGAVLQAYALQKALTNAGHQVNIIDYKNPFIESLYEVNFNKRNLLSGIVHLSPLKEIKRYKTNRAMKYKYECFRKDYLNLSAPVYDYKSIGDYDLYIIGSDQMWSLECYGGKYDNVYWGDFPRNAKSKLIGYAISSNCDFTRYMSLSSIEEAVKRYDNLSFREEKTSDLINRITGVKCPITIDPTLLLEKEEWEKLCDSSWKSKKKYIVVFQGRNPKRPDVYIAAEKYAKKHNLDIYDVTREDCGPLDFLSSIKYADCVFTSSFHATVFSIIFGTPFYSYVQHDGGDSRYINLLTSLLLGKHLCDGVYHDSKLEVDLNKVNQYLPSLRQESLDFLRSSVSES